MNQPIKSKMNGVFIPVSSIEDARDWYCRLFDVPNDGEIFFGHIYVIPLEGSVNIILDSKIYTPDCVYKVPSIQLASDNIQQSYEYVRSLGIEPLTSIQNDQWFNIQDPYGNVLMICQ